MTKRIRQHTTNVYLKQRQVNALDALRQNTKVPTSQRIREAIDIILEKYGIKKQEEKK